MHNVYPLPLPRVQRTKVSDDALLTGCAYPATIFANLSAQYPEGIVAGYNISPELATIQAASADSERLYVYDADHITTPSLQANHLQLNNGFTQGPEMWTDELASQLQMQMEFALQLSTHACDAQLGVIHLVQTQRHINLQNGEQIALIECEEPVLYLDENNEQLGIEVIADLQPFHLQRDYQYGLQLQQIIPDHIDDKPVETVTVLEQYQSYFMQRPCVTGQSTIWTPLLPPVSWGWSIRVGRRADGPWTIVRRKLILPSVGQDGLQLPLWQGNTRLMTLDVGH